LGIQVCQPIELEQFEEVKPEEPELFREWCGLRIPRTSRSKRRALKNYQYKVEIYQHKVGIYQHKVKIYLQQHQQYQGYLTRIELYNKQVPEIVNGIIQANRLSM
jgi:hypothetical protein